MLRRVNPDDHRGVASIATQAPEQSAPIVAAIADADFDTSRLPPDHPQWVRDTLTISTKARELLARLRPVIITIVTFWDHRVRALAIGNARVSVDPSGSYRVDYY